MYDSDSDIAYDMIEDIVEIEERIKKNPSRKNVDELREMGARMFEFLQAISNIDFVIICNRLWEEKGSNGSKVFISITTKLLDCNMRNRDLDLEVYRNNFFKDFPLVWIDLCSLLIKIETAKEQYTIN